MEEKFEHEDVHAFDNGAIHNLKKNIGDTLSFLHQERNDFLPNDEIVLPLNSTATIVSSTPFKHDTKILETIPSLDETEYKDVSEAMNEHVDSCTLALKKSEEAFSFLEHEDDKSLSPMIETINENSNHVKFDITVDKKQSAIPKLKQQNKKEKYLKDEKDVDMFLLQEEEDKLESDILSRIPVSAGKNVKVKTIKKHSKDPLKEFVKLVNADGTWDESKIEQTLVKPNELEFSSQITEFESNNLSPKSKIPVLTDSAKSSPTQDSKRDLVDSDSDTDSRQSPPLRGILKKSSMRTLGSSSGSDIALHEAGGELSDDDTGNIYFLLIIIN